MGLRSFRPLIVNVKLKTLRLVQIILHHLRIVTALLEDRASAFFAKLRCLIATALFCDMPKFAFQSIGVILAEQGELRVNRRSTSAVACAL